MVFPIASSSIICLSTIFLLICSSSYVKISDGRVITGFGTVHLNITNDLGSEFPLSTHCRSKDNDIGPHVLSFQESLNWHFKNNLFTPSTLFYCSMEWGTVSTSFDVYDEKYDMHRCDAHCWWSIRQDGAYFFDETIEDYELKHKW